jgi:Cupin-like domain
MCNPVAASGRSINDEWRRWIAECLLLGQSSESICEVMIAYGFDAIESTQEVKVAGESPYLLASDRLQSRLKKRDWLLAVYRKSGRLHPSSYGIDRRHHLSRDEFLRDYYSTNRPVIITGMMNDWPAMEKWSLDYFSAHFGDREVEVQMGRTASENYEIDHKDFVRRARFGDFLESTRTAGETNDFYLTAQNCLVNRDLLPELWDDIVHIPEYLAADRSGCFLWIGPAGTVTPFHHDLTNNFVAQVIGRKRLKIAPSWEMPLMQNHFDCFCRVDGRVVPSDPRPSPDQPQIVECILDRGEILFLPVGSLHHVEALDVSVTVTFTNFVFDNDFSSFYSTFGPV